MKFRVAYVTHTGTVRDANQDSLLMQEVLVSETSLAETIVMDREAETAWFIVADGMGGEALGEVASAETLLILEQHLPAMTSMAELPAILQKARDRLDEIAHDRKTRLGTTLAGLFVSPQESFVFNVGDCRVYQVGAGLVTRLTKDHSLLEMASEAGMPIGNVPRNLVTSAVLGGEKAGDMQIFSKAIPCRPKDQFLICSDGLWGALPPEDLENAVRHPEPQTVMTALLAAALPLSDDNISGILVEIL